MIGIRKIRREPTWRPAVFVGSDSTIGAWFLVIISMVRGLDYLRTGDSASKSLDLVEQTFTLRVWGIGFLAGTAVLAAALLLRKHFLIWLGHGILLICYFVLGLGLILPQLPFQPGIRTGFDILYLAFAHYCFWIRTGPRPLGSDSVATGHARGGENAAA